MGQQQCPCLAGPSLLDRNPKDICQTCVTTDKCPQAVLCTLQSIFAAAFTNGLAIPAAKAAVAVEGTTCSSGTFLAAQYSLALTNTIASNATAAGQAFAAANNIKYGGCTVAAAVGASVAMATVGCAKDTVAMLHGDPVLSEHQLLCLCI